MTNAFQYVQKNRALTRRCLPVCWTETVPQSHSSVTASPSQAWHFVLETVPEILFSVTLSSFLDENILPQKAKKIPTVWENLCVCVLKLINFCLTRSFLVVVSEAYSSWWLLIVVASHCKTGSKTCGLSSCGAQFAVAHSMWDFPKSVIEHVSPCIDKWILTRWTTRKSSLGKFGELTLVSWLLSVSLPWRKNRQAYPIDLWVGLYNSLFNSSTPIRNL